MAFWLRHFNHQRQPFIALNHQHSMSSISMDSLASDARPPSEPYRQYLQSIAHEWPEFQHLRDSLHTPFTSGSTDIIIRDVLVDGSSSVSYPSSTHTWKSTVSTCSVDVRTRFVLLDKRYSFSIPDEICLALEIEPYFLWSMRQPNYHSPWHSDFLNVGDLWMKVSRNASMAPGSPSVG